MTASALSGHFTFGPMRKKCLPCVSLRPLSLSGAVGIESGVRGNRLAATGVQARAIEAPARV